MPILIINLQHLPAARLKFAKALCFTAACVAIGASANLAHSQHKIQIGDALVAFQGDPVLKAWGENSEVRKCGICHYAPGNAFAWRDTDFCQLTEAKIWLERDKHAVSRQRIEPLSQDELVQKRKEAAGEFLSESNLVSYRMCQQLGYDLATKEGYASFRDNCLTCHAGYDPKQQIPAEEFASSNKHHPGISCNYCHQVGENSRWVDLHGGFAAKQDWRLLASHEKEAAGMRDLVDAGAQAKLCTSCHIGDHERQMFVTHEMYVAGHPPLPSFELQTFVSKMPPHWRDLKDSYAALLDYPLRDTFYAVNLKIPKEHIPIAMTDMFWETRTMLLGAVQAAEQSVALIAYAGANQHWGNYALYDCASCHHELRLPSLRQQRAASELPGRPRLLEWPTPLVEVAVLLTDPANGVKEANGNLLRLINQTPFGNPTDCLPAALALGDALKRTATQLAKTNIRAEQARKIVQLLAHTSDDSLLDYNAARQVIWAIQLVERELDSQGHRTPGHKLQDSARASIRELGRHGQQTLVSTDFPAGRSGTLYTPIQATTGVEQPSYLAAELQRMREYDPHKIQTQLRELCSQLD